MRLNGSRVSLAIRRRAARDDDPAGSATDAAAGPSAQGGRGAVAGPTAVFLLVDSNKDGAAARASSGGTFDKWFTPRTQPTGSVTPPQLATA